MKANSDGDTTSGLSLRVIISLVLVIISGAVCWYLTSFGEGFDWLQWFSSVSAGLAVLALVSIWISYFVEKEAARSITKEIDSRIAITTACFDASLRDIYYRPSDNGARYRRKLRDEIDRATDEIKIYTVAGSSFLHEGTGFAYDNMKRFVERGKLKILLLHPWCEQAVSRGLREDELYSFYKYRNTRLFQDILRSCRQLVDLEESGRQVEARLYKVFPACFLMFVNDVVFVEQFHFGRGGRAGGTAPILEAHRSSAYYGQLRGHSQHVWDTAAKYKLSKELVSSLDEFDKSDEYGAFTSSIEFSRPDIVEQLKATGRGSEPV